MANDKKYDAYLAGGWFNEAQAKALDCARALLEAACISYYDPKHMCLCPPDATEDFATYVLNENLKQIRDAGFVYASIEGRDLGTVFEVGYAKAEDRCVLYSSAPSTVADVLKLESTDLECLLLQTEHVRSDYSSFVVCNTADKDLVQVALAGYAYACKVDVIYYCEGLPEGAQFNLMLARTACAVCTTAEDLELCMMQAKADANWSRPYTGLIE
jgi:hypothetical protein